MLATLPEFVAAYWMYLAAGAVVLAGLSYYSEKFFSYLKKGVLLFLILFGLAAGYEYVTGNSLFSLPGSIDRELARDPERVETGRRYYKSYEERYGEPPPPE